MESNDPTYERPYLYPKQAAFVDDPAKVVCVEASTKAGKTTAMLVWFLEQGLQHWHIPGHNPPRGWWVAPVFAQAEIAFGRLVNLIQPYPWLLAKPPNYSKRMLTLFTGCELWFKSGHKPDNLFGDDVYFLIVDEASRLVKRSYEACRSVLTKTSGKMAAIGNVVGTNNWFYELCRLAEEKKLHFVSYHRLVAMDAVEGGVFKREDLEEQRALLDARTFAELYEARPLQQAENPWYYNFKREVHEQLGVDYNPNLPVYLSFDFNYDPMTCIAFHFHKGRRSSLHVFKEYSIKGSIHDMCALIRKDFKPHMLRVTGDATGRAHSALTQGTISSYDIIVKELKLSWSQIDTPTANLGHHNSRAVVNAALYYHDVRINANCTLLIQDLLLTEAEPDGHIDKSQEELFKRGHKGDAFRYAVHTYLADI
jgi:hypothetical protein